MGTKSERSNAPVLPIASSFQPISSSFQRSLSPSGRLCSSSSSSSSFASSTNSSFCSSPSTDYYHRRPTSPTRVNLHGFAPLSSSVRFSVERSSSPSRSMAVSPREQLVRRQNINLPKRTCSCAPTTHPGSFRCAFHKKYNNSHSMSYSPNRLNARRSAMTNSLVRIGTVEGDLVKRALAALIRPSSHQQRRREGFQPRPSRLSNMLKAEDL